MVAAGVTQFFQFVNCYPTSFHYILEGLVEIVAGILEDSWQEFASMCRQLDVSWGLRTRLLHCCKGLAGLAVGLSISIILLLLREVGR